MPDQSPMVKTVMRVVSAVAPDRDRIAREVDDCRRAHPKYDREKLAQAWGNRICWLFAAEGAATALPGVIPGIGTAAQVAIESGAISADGLYMFRCQAGLTMGIARIYGRDLDAPFNQDFVRVLGLWCGALTLSKEGLKVVGTKVAVAQFKKLPAEVFKRINRRVGTTIRSKYGTKRGGVAVGRLVPLGVGALVGGGFNLATMKAFKRAAIWYYGTNAVELPSEQDGLGEAGFRGG